MRSPCESSEAALQLTRATLNSGKLSVVATEHSEHASACNVTGRLSGLCHRGCACQYRPSVGLAGIIPLQNALSLQVFASTILPLLWLVSFF